MILCVCKRKEEKSKEKNLQRRKSFRFSPPLTSPDGAAEVAWLRLFAEIPPSEESILLRASITVLTESLKKKKDKKTIILLLKIF